MKKIIYVFFLLFSVTIFAQNIEKKLIDMDNRVITLDKDIEALVTIGAIPAINSFLFAMGKVDLIKSGVRDYSLKSFSVWKNQTYFLKNIFDLPQVSSNPPEWNPNFEVLLPMRFDIGLVSSPVMADALEARGIKAVVINWKKADSVKKTMLFLGELFHEQERVEKYLTYYDNNMNMIESITKGLNKKKSIYLGLDSMTIPMTSTANELLRKAGAITPTSNLTIENAALNIETLLVWDPDVIFVWNPSEVETAYKDIRFKNLTAVKNREVYLMPIGAHMWAHYTPEQPLAALWCAKKLYPESFKHIDIYKEAKRFYKEFMNQELTDAQLTSILER
ncbi:MAG TPA: ABC transporter substrate-binding protein [Sulfurimonas sp.]|uniref:ABC transporter substrate-binding protein n=1 Tax=Sulfurimonas sp. TaxID=2022749 RepID=UPI002C444FC9|nr:ABC transporter substrate-binding protein [Sulfurimonas sp.]HUH42910.1 ABC transporter substrate-binding protein [Sulfurimonas sp.]